MVTWSSLLALTIFFFSFDYNKIAGLSSQVESLPDNFVRYSVNAHMLVVIHYNTQDHPGTTYKYCFMRMVPNSLDGSIRNQECVNSITERCAQWSNMCSNRVHEVSFNLLTPKTDYITINMMKSDGGSLISLDERVYGFQTPYIMNPIFKLSYKRPHTTTLDMFECKDMRCTLKYNGIVYFESITAKCGTQTFGDLTEFNLMIPFYILECINYPIILLNMSNQAFKDTLFFSPPIYEVYYNKKDGNHLYIIELRGYYSNEICYFGYRDRDDYNFIDPRITLNSFISKCSIDKPTQKCYAPCNKVALIAESNDIAEIQVLIQNRHHFSMENVPIDINRDTSNKYVLTRGGENTNTLATQRDDNIFLNVTMIKHPSFDIRTDCICHVLYVAFYKTVDSMIREREYVVFSSLVNSLKSFSCYSQQDGVMLEGLPAGMPMVIYISVVNVNIGIRYHVSTYIVTDPTPSNRFDPKGAKAVGSTIEIKAAKVDAKKLSKSTPTCIYYVSETSANLFTEANCGNNLCRGLCKFPQKIIGLDYNTTYDVMVIANEIHGTYTYKSIRLGD